MALVAARVVFPKDLREEDHENLEEPKEHVPHEEEQKDTDEKKDEEP